MYRSNHQDVGGAYEGGAYEGGAYEGGAYEGGAYADIRNFKKTPNKPQTYGSYPYEQSSSTFDSAMLSKSREHRYEQKQGTLPILKHGVLTPSRPSHASTAGPLDTGGVRSVGEYASFDDLSPHGSYFPRLNRRTSTMARQSVTSGRDAEEYTGTNMAAKVYTCTNMAANLHAKTNVAPQELDKEQFNDTDVYVNFSSEVDLK